MPVNNKYIEDFIEEGCMHMICKSVGNTDLFKNDENRLFFLKKYAFYSRGYFDTFSYILMKNHVHWLTKCTNGETLRKYLGTLAEEDLKKHQLKFLEDKISFSEALEFQCKDFFISYSMAYNKMFGRTGALFVNPFRRVAVKNEEHLLQLMVYIHANITKHGVSKDFQNYKWSSYKAVLSNKPTLVPREQVLDMVGGRNAFIELHKESSAYYYEHVLAME